MDLVVFESENQLSKPDRELAEGPSPPTIWLFPLIQENVPVCAWKIPARRPA